MYFTSQFYGGNGKLLSSQCSENGWEIVFLAECKAREPQALWFHFKICDLHHENVRIRFANSHQCLGMAWAWSLNRPVYRINGEDWKRVEIRKNEETPEHCWSTWFSFTDIQGELEIAFCYPYTETTLADTLSVCPTFSSSVIGYSTTGNPICRLSNSFGTDNDKKPGIYIIGRQHSGEVTGSWVMDGMLRWLSSSAGKEALEKLVWWIVPFADIDGVANGCYGKDQLYGDFNRAWREWFPARTEVYALQDDILKWKKNTSAKLLLDLHSPGHDERTSYFVVTHDTIPSYRNELRTVQEYLNRFLADFSLQPSGFREKTANDNTSAQTGLTSTQYAHMQNINGVTYECSYQGEPEDRSYDIHDYRNIGSAFARALSELYGNIN